MEPFLKKVAEAFLKNVARLDGLCFVFPNRRSGAFFRKYLSEGAAKPLLFPEILTISDFVAQQSGFVDAGRIEQLFALYKAYSRLSENVVDFNHFLYWGDMILGDFNDVDRYMVDAGELFVNVENYKDINANYLTDEQLAVLNNFFGEFRIKEDERLWTGKQRYVRLWNILNGLYDGFKGELLKRGLSYPGYTYRVAAEKVKKKYRDDFEFEKIVFIGFSTLSKSEEVIFDALRNCGIGDFYWDFNSPAFKDYENKGTLFLKEYVKKYPSFYDIEESPVLYMPEISIISVPSGGGQAKVAGELIRQLIRERKIADPADAIDTALVLTDEKYLGSVISSVPAEIGSLNITMGYPMTNTAVSSFMRILAVMYSRKRIRNGVVSFYYDDIDSLLSHPYVSCRCMAEIDKFKKEVVDKRLFFVEVSTIMDLLPSVCRLFQYEEFHSVEEIFAYIEDVVNFLGGSLPVAGVDGNMDLERFFICRYLDSLSELKEMMRLYDVGDVSDKTLFFLIERMISGSVVAFEGEPMQGLQVMGVLETRLLDFRNIIIFSMNEKVFPARHYTRSFIPESLRAAYGISTYHKQDSMFTYYFYRMISRAENVFLLYDSRTQGVASGEVSRYISQLKQLYKRGQCKDYFYSYDVLLPVDQEMAINKSAEIMSRLLKYTEPDSGMNFSASMVNTYLECPVRFYFKYVEGIREEDEMKDFVDSATFGTIVHEVMQQIYDAVPEKNGKRLVEKSFLDRFAHSDSMELRRIVANVVKQEYDKNGNGGGDVDVINNIVIYYIVPILKYDMGLIPFEYIGSELEQTFRWNLGKDLVINYKQKIDRLDRSEGTLRIVDYKTGNDDVSVKDLDSIFEGNNSAGHKKAVLQILLYCNAYAAISGCDDDIKPVIYKVRDIRKMSPEDKFGIKLGTRDVMTTYRNGIFDKEFMEKFRTVATDILDPEVPFKQTVYRDKCVYCPFAEACGRD